MLLIHFLVQVCIMSYRGNSKNIIKYLQIKLEQVKIDLIFFYLKIEAIKYVLAENVQTTSTYLSLSGQELSVE